MSTPVAERIQAMIAQHPVILFMKGTAEAPQCGFSAAAAGILGDLGVDFLSVDVLRDPELREGIKQFSQWPTIPQLYVNQEFIGGSDIVKQMAASGELHSVLGVPFEAPKAPHISLSPAMETVLRGAGLQPGEHLRLIVEAGFRYDLGVDTPKAGDFLVDCGEFKVIVDPASARRADGIRLDHKAGPGGGVLIDNPNEPARVKDMEVHALKELLDSDRNFRLIDVRGPDERSVAMLSPRAEMLDANLDADLSQLPKDTLLIFHCHHGGRSAAMAQRYVGKGFTKVYNLSGGIDAWSLFVDPNVPRY